MDIDERHESIRKEQFEKIKTGNMAFLVYIKNWKKMKVEILKQYIFIIIVGIELMVFSNPQLLLICRSTDIKIKIFYFLL